MKHTVGTAVRRSHVKGIGLLAIVWMLGWTGGVWGDTDPNGSADPNTALTAQGVDDANVPADVNATRDANAPAAEPNAPASVLSLLMDRPEVVRSIEFAGNKKYKDSVLRKRIGIELGERYDPFLAEGGRRTLIDLYKKIGYAFVTVTLDQDKAKTGRLFYTIDEGPRARIRAVRFTGNHVFSDGVLAKVVKLKSQKWLLLPSYYSADLLEESLDQLEEFYYKNGYLGYSVSADTEFNKSHNHVVVTFKVDEGPAYTIEEILFAGNQRFDVNELRAAIEIHEGQIYKRDVADLSARHIQDKYLKQGFLDAQVTQGPKYEPDPNKAVVTVEFDIHEGDQFRIGRIDISGNENAQDKVVRRVLDEYNFTPGELYDATLAPSQGRSQLENYVKYATKAEDVVIRPVPPEDGSPATKDVRVNVKEGMTGLIMPGVGFSTDNGVMGHLVYQQRNFDISDKPENLKDLLTMKAFRGAGQTLNLSLEPGTEYHRYTLSFSDPYFHDKPIGYNLEASSFDRWYESYKEQRARGLVGFDFRNWGGWSKSFSVRAENVEAKNLDNDAPQEIRNISGYTTLLGFKVGTGINTLDDPMMPTQGHRLGIYYEQVTGGYDYGLLTGSFTWYKPLYEDVFERRTVLATKLLAGTVLGQAPPFEKFYGGGMGTYAIRGFSYRGVSQRGLQVFDVPDPNVTPRYKDPVGSDWIVIGSAEVIVPLVDKNLSGFIFTDAALLEDTHDPVWRWSAGLGLQITVPQVLGEVPMRFELGFPIQKGKYDEAQTFNFSMGIPF